MLANHPYFPGWEPALLAKQGLCQHSVVFDCVHEAVGDKKLQHKHYRSGDDFPRGIDSFTDTCWLLGLDPLEQRLLFTLEELAYGLDTAGCFELSLVLSEYRLKLFEQLRLLGADRQRLPVSSFLQLLSWLFTRVQEVAPASEILQKKGVAGADEVLDPREEEKHTPSNEDEHDPPLLTDHAHHKSRAAADCEAHAKDVVK